MALNFPDNPSNGDTHTVFGNEYTYDSTADKWTVLVSATGPHALVASPGLTGVPTAPTAAAGTNTTQLATTAFVEAAVTASSTSITEPTIPDWSSPTATFTASGSWTKTATNDQWVWILGVGGGGSGGKGNNSNGNGAGGGGGDGVLIVAKGSEIASSISFTIGAAGAHPGNNNSGNAGGDTVITAGGTVGTHTADGGLGAVLGTVPTDGVLGGGQVSSGASHGHAATNHGFRSPDLASPVTTGSLGFFSTASNISVTLTAIANFTGQKGSSHPHAGAAAAAAAWTGIGGKGGYKASGSFVAATVPGGGGSGEDENSQAQAGAAGNLRIWITT